jgi:hypothetical protein
MELAREHMDLQELVKVRRILGRLPVLIMISLDESGLIPKVVCMNALKVSRRLSSLNDDG